jgi:3',5'-cyclic AMP phosphodiesterase CpdA
MKRIQSLNKAALLIMLCTVLIFSGCRKKEKELFTMAFLTDIHLQPELNAVEGFTLALDSINRLKPDLILTGGDLIMDALGQSYGRADSLYDLYNEVVKKADSKVYNTMGNHEIYGIYSRSGADPSHPEFGEKMFETRFGNSYYSFEHKGWKFIVLNSIEDSGKDRYIGLIDSTQVEWLKKELGQTGIDIPIVVSTHIPLITAYSQKYEGSTIGNDSSRVVYNSKEIIDLFDGHNLKLVLQGHLHTVEDVYIDGIHFITSGAICGSKWRGPNRGFEEGFVHLTFYADDFRWRYVDYGWTVK